MAGNSIVFTDNLDEVLRALDGALETGLVKIGAAAQGYAKDNTPVRTGNLANSVDWEEKEDEKAVYVGFSKEKTTTDVKYAIFVEEGSRNNKAHHMLRRAATEHNAEYRKIMEDAMKNA